MSDGRCGTCATCQWGAIPLVCSEVERAIRASERKRLGDLVRAASDQKHIAAFLKAIEDEEVRRLMGVLMHVVYAVLTEEEK